MVKPTTKMVFIVGDGTQKIYRRDVTWKDLGFEVTPQNSFILNKSYRSTREIIDIALELVRDSQTIIQDLNETGDGIIDPDKQYDHYHHGPLPMLLTFASPEKEYEG